MTTKLRYIFPVFILLLISGAFTSCNDGFTFRPPDYSLVPPPYDISNSTPINLDTGLKYYIVQEGVPFLGPVAERDDVRVRYTLRLDDGTIEDSSYRDQNPDPVRFNLTEVIRGFREGMLGMVEGEKRVIMVPPNLGYGNQPGHRLRNENLRYDVELVAIID
jgi:FKBP-type peptidyl-prolyl cis-trans isomerase